MKHLFITTVVVAIAALASPVRADNPFDRAMPPLTSPEVAQIQLDDGTLWQDPKAFRRLTYIPETRAARAELYAAALLSALTLEQARRLEGDVIAGATAARDTADVVAEVARFGLGATSAASDVAELTRWARSAGAAAAQGANLAGIEQKVAARFGQTRLGQAGRWAGPLATALTVASEYREERARVAILQAALHDAQALAALDALAEAAQGLDPALGDGVQMAHATLARHSEQALQSLTDSSVRALLASRSSVAGLGIGTVASGGTALVLREAVELGVSVDEFVRGAMVIAAQHNFVTALSPALAAQGQDSFAAQRADVLLHAMTLEAGAAIYNALWTDRWDLGFSLARLGKAMGIEVADVRGAGEDLQATYGALIGARAARYATLHRALSVSSTSQGPALIDDFDFDAYLDFYDLVANDICDLVTVPAGFVCLVTNAGRARVVPADEAPAGSDGTRAAGETFQDFAGAPVMMVIPAGEFTMGSPEGQRGRDSDEGPLRRMSIGSFALSATEVTFAQWDLCVEMAGCNYRPDDEGWGRGDRPVINVSWEDAQEYIGWLNGRTGGGYSLPSEAQWEYAARAGTTTPFYTGERITTAQANFDGDYTYNGSSKGTDREQTVSVGSFAPNGFGLYDMHGNVWEWTQDCWVGNLSGHASDGRANLDGDCDRRVLRGGSWDDKPNFLRSAYRDRLTTSSRADYLGFRLLKTL